MEKTHASFVVPTTSISLGKIADTFFRRALDIIASFTGLLLLLPLFGLVAIAIKRDSPGPVFFRGGRAGKNGKSFDILKFRTMYERPDCYAGPRVTAAGDRRITPLGQWLRDTKVNELPQLWNVLVGEMSLVGPRPEDIELVKMWPAHLRKELLSVRPGITSPATVVFRQEEKLLSTGTLMDDYLQSVLPNKLRIDALYVRRRTIMTDLDIIFLTVILLLPRINKSEVPESVLYWGPIAQFVSRHLNWFVLDSLMALIATVLAGLLWRLDAPLNLGWQVFLGIALAAGLCFSVCNAILGLTRIQWRRAQASDAFFLAASTALTSLFLIMTNAIFFTSGLLTFGRSYTDLPLGMLLTAGLLSFFGFVAIRYRTRLLTGLAARWTRLRNAHRSIGERVLLVGAGSNSQLATWLLTRSDLARAFSIVGIVDDDPRKQGMLFDGFPVVGTTRQIPALVSKLDIGVVIYTISNIEFSERQDILQLCQRTPAHLILLPDLMAELQQQFLKITQSKMQPSAVAND
jgi:lipopolysaccharide/colanic/teichoic acid biosynthesis glycosyltransferase